MRYIASSLCFSILQKINNMVFMVQIQIDLIKMKNQDLFTVSKLILG